MSASYGYDAWHGDISNMLPGYFSRHGSRPCCLLQGQWLVKASPPQVNKTPINEWLSCINPGAITARRNQVRQPSKFEKGYEWVLAVKAFF